MKTRIILLAIAVMLTLTACSAPEQPETESSSPVSAAEIEESPGLADPSSAPEESAPPKPEEPVQPQTLPVPETGSASGELVRAMITRTGLTASAACTVQDSGSLAALGTGLTGTMTAAPAPDAGAEQVTVLLMYSLDGGQKEYHCAVQNGSVLVEQPDGWYQADSGLAGVLEQVMPVLPADPEGLTAQQVEQSDRVVIRQSSLTGWSERVLLEPETVAEIAVALESLPAAEGPEQPDTGGTVLEVTVIRSGQSVGYTVLPETGLARKASDSAWCILDPAVCAVLAGAF